MTETVTKLISLLCLLVVSFEAIKLAECFSGGGVKIIMVDNKYTNSQVRTENNFDSVRKSNSPNENNNKGNTQDGSGTNPPKAQPSSTKLPTRGSLYFGMSLVPYVRSDGFPQDNYTVDNLKKMLKVILTKSRSVLTLEMGYQYEGSVDSDGRYDMTTPSRISIAAAQLNLETDIPLITISQGACFPRWNHSSTTEYDAAIYAATNANSIYPGTVWSITFDYTSLIQQKKEDAFAKIMANVLPYSKKIRALNLKFGLYIDDCENILSLKDPRFTLQNLIKLTSLTDFMICTIYPSKPIQEVREYFQSVRTSFDSVKKEFAKYAPQVKLYLMTGWAAEKWSIKNPPYMTSPVKAKQLWDMMESWADQLRQKVFMNSAFDNFIDYENGLPRRKDYFGYFKRADNNSDDKYVVKATGEILNA